MSKYVKSFLGWYKGLDKKYRNYVNIALILGSGLIIPFEWLLGSIGAMLRAGLIIGGSLMLIKLLERGKKKENRENREDEDFKRTMEV